jgi:hypothetical protein
MNRLLQSFVHTLQTNDEVEEKKMTAHSTSNLVASPPPMPVSDEQYEDLDLDSPAATAASDFFSIQNVQSPLARARAPFQSSRVPVSTSSLLSSHPTHPSPSHHNDHLTQDKHFSPTHKSCTNASEGFTSPRSAVYFSQNHYHKPLHAIPHQAPASADQLFSQPHKFCHDTAGAFGGPNSATDNSQHQYQENLHAILHAAPASADQLFSESQATTDDAAVPFGSPNSASNYSQYLHQEPLQAFNYEAPASADQLFSESQATSYDAAGPFGSPNAASNYSQHLHQEPLQAFKYEAPASADQLFSQSQKTSDDAAGAFGCSNSTSVYSKHQYQEPLQAINYEAPGSADQLFLESKTTSNDDAGAFGSPNSATNYSQHQYQEPLQSINHEAATADQLFSESQATSNDDVGVFGSSNSASDYSQQQYQEPSQTINRGVLAQTFSHDTEKRAIRNGLSSPAIKQSKPMQTSVSADQLGQNDYYGAPDSNVKEHDDYHDLSCQTRTTIRSFDNRSNHSPVSSSKVSQSPSGSQKRLQVENELRFSLDALSLVENSLPKSAVPRTRMQESTSSGFEVESHELMLQYKRTAERLENEKAELLDILAAQAEQFYVMQAYIEQLQEDKMSHG